MQDWGRNGAAGRGGRGLSGRVGRRVEWGRTARNRIIWLFLTRESDRRAAAVGATPCAEARS